MTDGFAKALNLINADLEKNGTLEDGDEIAYVCNDGVIIVSLKDGTLGINTICGKPPRLDVHLDLLEKSPSDREDDA